MKQDHNVRVGSTSKQLPSYAQKYNGGNSRATVVPMTNSFASDCLAVPR